MNYLNQIITGDALAVLQSLPDSIVRMCVTSPPYYGLRDYGIEGQIGLEETPDCGMREPGRLEIRPDLTPDEFEYVLRELRQCGLL